MNETDIYDHLLERIKAKDTLYVIEKLHRISINRNLILNLEHQYTSEYNCTMLICAAKYGLDDLVNELIMLGANLNATSGRKFTALHYAARFGYLMIVIRLLTVGSDINAKTDINVTPLYLALFDGHLKVAKYLIKKGADLTVATKQGITSLMLVEARGFTDILELIKMRIQKDSIKDVGELKTSSGFLGSKSLQQNIIARKDTMQSPVNSEKQTTLDSRKRTSIFADESERQLLKFLKTLPPASVMNRFEVKQCIPAASNLTEENCSPQLSKRLQ